MKDGKRGGVGWGDGRHVPAVGGDAADRLDKGLEVLSMRVEELIHRLHPVFFGAERSHVGKALETLCSERQGTSGARFGMVCIIRARSIRTE